MNRCLYVIDADVMYEVRLHDLIISSVVKHDRSTAMRTEVKYEALSQRVQDLIFDKLLDNLTTKNNAT